jgi:hypothetical protein
MKPIRTAKPWRSFVVLILALASVCWLVPGEAVPQQQPSNQGVKKESAKPPAPATEMRVFQAKHVLARDLARTIQEIWGNTLMRISVDERINSVIVMAIPEDLVKIEALLNKIEDASPGRSKPAHSVRVFPLKYTRADPNVDHALRLILLNQGGNLTVDPQRNVVTVLGDEQTLEAAEKLLRRLDVPQDKPTISEMQVRVVWLATEWKEAAKPPEDLKAVVSELAKMGVEAPGLVTQTLVTALPDTPFRVEGLAGPGSTHRLSISGKVLGRPGETNRLQISIHAHKTTKPGSTPDQVGRLETEITAPPGHLVVLGMTPTATSTSVFVVQILPKK